MGLAAAIGTGLDINLSDEMFIGAEARYQYLANVTYDASSAGKAQGISEVKGPASMINLFVRIGRTF
jgi:opacity protein-like surface antigen